MLAHKVFVTASAFHGQQLLQPLAARHTLSLPYAIFSSNAAVGDCDSAACGHLSSFRVWDQLIELFE